MDIMQKLLRANMDWSRKNIWHTVLCELSGDLYLTVKTMVDGFILPKGDYSEEESP